MRDSSGDMAEITTGLEKVKKVDVKPSVYKKSSEQQRCSIALHGASNTVFDTTRGREVYFTIQRTALHNPVLFFSEAGEAWLKLAGR